MKLRRQAEEFGRCRGTSGSLFKYLEGRVATPCRRNRPSGLAVCMSRSSQASIEARAGRLSCPGGLPQLKLRCGLAKYTGRFAIVLCHKAGNARVLPSGALFSSRWPYSGSMKGRPRICRLHPIFAPEYGNAGDSNTSQNFQNLSAAALECLAHSGPDGRS